MFTTLTDYLTTGVSKLRNLRRLTDENIQSTLHDIRSALLKADVALSVIEQLIEQIREKAVGQKIIAHIKPGDAFIKIVQDEFTHILGDEKAEINLNNKSPIVILMAGLQGSGKTTTTAKLAHWLQETHLKSVMLASADVYRPAAIEQLKTLATQTRSHYFPTQANQDPVEIATSALKQAEKQFIDILILDTAGRLHIDDKMMQEVKAISNAITPTETLLVVDSMTGQDAAQVAKSFNASLSLTGVILTKADGDARGGAALSMRLITGKPIKFLGVGEKIDALELFHPERMASRILGMGDIISLVEEAQRKVDQKQAKKIAGKLKKGVGFDFDDFLTQLQQFRKMGSLQSLLSKLPHGSQLPKEATTLLDEKWLTKMQAMIQSMTFKERRFPTLLNGSRKRRIANGSGSTLQDINKLLKQFTQAQKMTKRFKGNKMAKRLKQMQSQFPGDFFNS